MSWRVHDDRAGAIADARRIGTNRLDISWRSPVVSRRALVAGLAAATALALGAVPALGAVRYAEPGLGGSTPGCPQADPCAIDEAVNGAAAGDEVVVLPGVYSIMVPLTVSDPNVVVHGQAGAARPQISTSAFVGLEIDDSSAVARDLEIVHSGTGRGLSLSGLGERLVVRSSASAACWVRGGTLRDSVCNATGPTTSGYGAIAAYGLMGDIWTATLRNVTAVSPFEPAITLLTDPSASVAIDAKSVIAQGPGGTGLDADIRVNAGTGATASVQLDHSNYGTVSAGSPGSTVTPPGSGENQTTPPTFVDEATGDFHQAEGSETIDAGAVDSSSGTLDLDGEPRTLGSAPDIGADEYTAPPSPPGPPSPPTGSQPPPGPSDSELSFALRAKRKLRLGRRGTVRVRLGCPAEEASPPCAVRLALRTQRKLALGKRKPRKLQLAPAKRYQLAAGERRRVRIKLKRRSLGLVRRLRRARKAVLVANVRDAAGNRLRVTRKLVLKP